MSYFPFFIELEGRTCLIVGGGDVAFRKIRELLPFGVDIHVVSKEICESILQLRDSYPEQLHFSYRGFSEKDIEDVFFVIAATDDEICNEKISEICRQHKILVNVVDDKEKCSFYFPSLVKRKNIVAGFSSGGNSPALIKELRRKLQEQIPDYYGALNENLGQIRPMVRKVFPTEAERKQFYQSVIHRSEKLNRALEISEIQDMLHKSFT